MFLLVKKGTSLILGLEGSDAVLATMYASIKEAYDEFELELSFERPNTKILKNLVLFINELNSLENNTEHKVITENKLEEITLGEEETLIDIEDEKIEDDEIIEALDFEETVTSSNDDITIEISEPEEVKEIEVQKPVVEIEEKVVPKVPNTPGDRMMESLKEQQKNEGLPDLEGDKVNTLVYKDHLISYMKLGFACNMLMKKTNDCNDTAEKAKLLGFIDSVQKRTDEFELKFKEIGLTTGQIFTFRMEVLRDVRKYKDDSIKEICDYINKLYSESDRLIETLK